jgi:D-glycero-D-manno-heptose 1,7-bisphosphate phosphatase
MQKLVILDRDGVINYESPEYIKSPKEWRALPGSIQAIVILNKKGYKVAIATNQSGIGRGYYDHDMLAAIHNKLLSSVKTANGIIDKLVYCPHTPEDNCLCRKPKPGMLYEILQFFNLESMSNSVYFVGDSISDITAAKAAGCQPILVLTGNGGSATIAKLDPEEHIPVFVDLLEFAKSL